MFAVISSDGTCTVEFAEAICILASLAENVMYITDAIT